MNKPRPRIDQLLAGIADGDATSHAAFAIRDALRELGYDSELYALPEHMDPATREHCQDIRTYKGTGDDVAIHHYGMYTYATDVFRSCAARKILLYHNITPADYFRGYSDTIQQALEKSRALLPELAQASAAVWTVSAFNAEELKAASVPQTRLFPLPFVASALDRPPDPEVQARLSAPLTTILCVGRIAPNKCVEELIEAFAIYRACYNPFSRLLIVGSPRSAPKYFTYLRLLAHDLRVPNVCFEGFASPSGLATYYANAQLFVNVSRHEGYCLPLLEAMHKGVPVISRRTGGTPEAMGNAGIAYADLTAERLAGLMHLTLTDADLRKEVLTSQQRRIEQEQRRNLAAELSELLP